MNHCGSGARLRRCLEFITIFVLLPLLFFLELLPVPKIAGLLLLTFVCLLLLLRDPGFERRRLTAGNATRQDLLKVFVRAGPIAVLLLLLALWQVPDGLFRFPRLRPGLWLLVMCLYPILSAYPQELVYRTFLFHRYQDVFRTRVARIAASAFAFALLHVIYDNVLAILLSLLGGWLFAYTYERTRSLLLVSLEHALYGMIIFTLGLGRFFYEGPR